MNESNLKKYISLAYFEARSQQTNVGRRQLKLQIINRFWSYSRAEKNELVQKAVASSVEASLSETDPDPHDVPGLTDSKAIGTRGIIVRTHFDPTAEVAWNSFMSSLEDLERRSLRDIVDSQMDADSESESEEEDETQESSNVTEQKETQDADMEAENQLSTATLAYETDAIFIIVDPTRQPPGRVSLELLSDASNIKLLRIFNDASIAPCPPLPANAPKRIRPGHRLIDEDELQEIYAGPIIWVWDQQSARDQTLRLVSSRVFVYGDATWGVLRASMTQANKTIARADSWRVKATHMWDLQVNMDAGMRVDFSGGVNGGWDMNERSRNLKDALS